MSIEGVSSCQYRTPNQLYQAFDTADRAALRELIISLLSSDEMIRQLFDLVRDQAVALFGGERYPFATNGAEGRGALLFLVLHLLAFNPNGDGNSQDTLLERIGGDPDCLTFLCEFHQIDAGLILKLRYLRCGTSSLIFKARSSIHSNSVLKVTQAQNIRIQSLQRATEAYKKTYQIDFERQPQPEIYQVGRSWILMEFISGVNLNEYANNIRKIFGSPKYIDLVSDVLLKLINALASDCTWRSNSFEYYGNNR